VLKKEIERWKEEVKVQEGKSALNSGRLKSEVDAHKETREKLDKLLTETRAENEKIRSEYSEFIKKLKEEEKRQKFAEQEQSVKVPLLYYVSPYRWEAMAISAYFCSTWGKPKIVLT
jgi:hypothetical protein